MTTAAAGVVLAASSFRLTDVVAMQQGPGSGSSPLEHLPAVLRLPRLLRSAFAETNRLPFDLPEAEAELVAGYHTEYSAMRFGALPDGRVRQRDRRLARSRRPSTSAAGRCRASTRTGVLGAIASLLRLRRPRRRSSSCVFIWVRWTLPRFRYDQLMRLGWKVLLPLALANLFWVAGARAVRMRPVTPWSASSSTSPRRRDRLRRRDGRRPASGQERARARRRRSSPRRSATSCCSRPSSRRSRSSSMRARSWCCSSSS